MINRRAALLITWYFLSVAPAAAGQFEDEITRVTHDADAADEISGAVGGGESNLVVVPIPIVDPTIGAGLALTGLYTFEMSEQPGTPRSTIGVAAGYTDSQSWLAGVGLKLYLDGDRYRLGAAAGYGHLNLEFFGVGSDSIFADQPVNFTTDGGFGEVTAQMRIMDGTYLGLKGRYLDADLSAKLPIDVLPTLTVKFQLVGAGPIFEYDTRDSTWWPTSGSQAIAEFLWFDEAIGSDASFSTFDGSFAHYWSPTDKLLLASEVRAAITSDDAPFFMNPFVSIRGFPVGQLLDAVVAQPKRSCAGQFWARSASWHLSALVQPVPILVRLTKAHLRSVPVAACVTAYRRPTD